MKYFPQERHIGLSVNIPEPTSNPGFMSAARLFGRLPFVEVLTKGIFDSEKGPFHANSEPSAADCTRMEPELIGMALTNAPSDSVMFDWLNSVVDTSIAGAGTEFISSILKD